MRSSVTVVHTHPAHGGKVGTVRRHTAKYVVVIFKDPAKKEKEVHISPKFLVRDEREPIGTISTITDSQTHTSLTTECEFYDASGIAQRDISGPVPNVSNLFGFGNYALEKICLCNATGAINVHCAFQKIWGSNYVSFEMPLDSNDLPLKRVIFDKEFELYHPQVNAQVGVKEFRYIKPRTVTAYYVRCDDLRAHEEMLGDFGSLPPSKVWARRKHFLSPAIKHKKEHAIYPVTSDDIVMIEDAGTVGTHFCANTRGIQRDANETKHCGCPPIQLNESLRKVGPSRSDEASDHGYVVIKNKFPSNANWSGVGRIFKCPNKRITKTFKDDVRKRRSCKLPDMYVRVMQSLGVPHETIKYYRGQYERNPEKLCHTNVVGVADPTSLLPPNSVFLTGTNAADFELDQLIVTRSPCMEAEDIRVINVVTTKPDRMGDDEWEWLQSLSFGALIFANPQPGNRPLPELIAEGDLDGDLYFVCWERTLLSTIQTVPITEQELIAPRVENIPVRVDPNWFDATQSYISRVPTLHSSIDRLVGELYTKSYEINDVRDPTAASFGKAYKEALDAKKHGRPVFLPGHLWDELPDNLHKYLVSDR
ncbi:hypothetical protein ACHAXR_007348 [Thalassiosira sp. AJA248-18]